MFFTKSVSHILLTFIDTVCLVNSFIFSYFAWSYNDLSRHLSKRSLTLLGLVELQSSWWWFLKNRDVVCIPGWPGLSLPATWSRGSYGIAGLPRLLPVLAISCLRSPPPYSSCLGDRMCWLTLVLTLLCVLRISIWTSSLVVAELSTCCTLLITLCPPVFPVLGTVSIGLWLLHSFLFFPSLFKWKEEYFCLSYMTKYIHNTRNSFVWLHSISYSHL